MCWVDDYFPRLQEKFGRLPSFYLSSPKRWWWTYFDFGRSSIGKGSFWFLFKFIFLIFMRLRWSGQAHSLPNIKGKGGWTKELCACDINEKKSTCLLNILCFVKFFFYFSLFSLSVFSLLLILLSVANSAKLAICFMYWTTGYMWVFLCLHKTWYQSHHHMFLYIFHVDTDLV